MDLLISAVLSLSGQFFVRQFFTCGIRWADFFCKRRGLEPVPENLRGALGEIIYKVRFPLMTAEEFTYDVIPTKVLTSEEQVQIFKFFCLGANGGPSRLPIEPSSFNCTLRNHMYGRPEIKAIKEEIDETTAKLKTEYGESPNCQPSLASHSNGIVPNLYNIFVQHKDLLKRL